MNEIKKSTIVRTALLVLTLINTGLALFGKSPMPFSSEEVTNAISFILTAVAALVAWWKNNSFTTAAIKADETLKALKGE